MAMSQSSQGSQCSNILSQETLNQLFQDSSSLLKNVGLDQNSQVLPISEFRSLPLDVQYSDNNAHENYEISMQAISMMKQDIQLEELPSCSLSQPFNQYAGGRSATTSYSTPPPSVSAASPYSNLNGVAGQDEQVSPSVISTPPPDVPVLAQPLIVSNVDFPGCFGFDIGFEEEFGVPTKSTAWTYSAKLKKLFVKMRVKVPIRMKLAVMPQQGHYIRAVVVYKQPEYYKEVVERCPNHITKLKDGHCAPNHLMRCDNFLTVYETCPMTNRHYIKIPVSEPQAGMDYFTEMFLFMCFSSCPGGLNRRPSLIIFTLENSCGQVCGRKVVNVRICACPGRDRINEEIAETKRRNPSHGDDDLGTPPVDPFDVSIDDAQPVSPKSPAEEASTSRDAEALAHAPRLTKKRSNQMMTTGFEMSGLSFGNPFKKIKKEEDSEIFNIQVKGREKFEMLLKIKESLDLMDMVPQAQLDAYRRSCPPCGPVRTPQTSQTTQNLQNSDSQKSTDSQDSEGTPPSSQFPLSQLSSGSSGSAHSISLSQGSQGGGGAGELTAIRFTLKRTVSLEKAHFRREDPFN